MDEGEEDQGDAGDGDQPLSNAADHDAKAATTTPVIAFKYKTYHKIILCKLMPISSVQFSNSIYVSHIVL